MRIYRLLKKKSNAKIYFIFRDGTRKKATEYRDCYLGKVKGNALVTNRDHQK